VIGEDNRRAQHEALREGLVALRKRSGLSQAELAEASTGLSRATVSRFEAGQSTGRSIQSAQLVSWVEGCGASLTDLARLVDGPPEALSDSHAYRLLDEVRESLQVSQDRYRALEERHRAFKRNASRLLISISRRLDHDAKAVVLEALMGEELLEEVAQEGGDEEAIG